VAAFETTLPVYIMMNLISVPSLVTSLLLIFSGLPQVIAQPVELNIQMVPGIWINGATGAVNIEYTTNLDQASGWTQLANVQGTNSSYFYIDGTATNAPKRFYRAVVENSSPVNPNPEHLVWIKPGTFTMGSPSTEVYRDSNEGPQTRVTISQGFWMSKYETTQEEYQSVMGINPSKFKGDANRPVEMVSWNDATDYCAKLTASEIAVGRLPLGYAYRLPTEAEWEYACRAGTTTGYSYGDDPNYTQLGNYAWYYIYGSITHAVGGKLPNAWGLYDMYGNVWEWCSDWYGTYPGGSVTDPQQGANSGSYRVGRGGSWTSDGGVCRTACRNGGLPDSGSDNFGFRSVLATGQ
jgi:formylglycine-generating enzyme required for sulfatase activity